MNDNSWVLHGVDAGARQAALAEAERRGLTLEAYLTEALLAEVALQHDDSADAPPPADGEAASPAPENSAPRHQVAPLQRRLTFALGGLEDALGALDDNILSLSAQLEQTDAGAEETAAALRELRVETIALRQRLGEAEESASAFVRHNDNAHDGFAARCAELEAHLASVEAIAYAADSAAAKLGAAHEALQRALAQDFNEFALETDRRIAASAEDLRAHAADAADRADAAALRAMETLRQARHAMEAGLADQAAETRAVVHGAFADAAERIDALADRVRDNQRIAQRMGEQLNARVNNMEDAANVAIEETADTLRSADAALSAAIARAEQDQHAALVDLAARQDARLNLVDAALQSALNDLCALNDGAQAALADVEVVAAMRHDALEASVQARLAEVIARLDLVADAATHDHQAAAANIDRVEACTLAALEKLAGDIEAGDAAQSRRAEAEFKRLNAHLALAQENAAAALTRHNAEFAANKERTDQALTTLSAAVDGRLKALERTASDARTEVALAALAALAKEVEALASQARAADADAQFTQLREHLSAHDAAFAATAEQVQDVARTISRVAAQSAGAAGETEERLHKLELSHADVRLELGGGASPQAVRAIAARIDQMEQAQNHALEALRDDIARFVSDNDERLAALEQGAATALSGDEVLIAHAIEARLSELEQRDVAGDFDALRRRIDERILSVESRSVRALEQIAETVAIIEKRYADDDDLAQTG